MRTLGELIAPSILVQQTPACELAPGESTGWLAHAMAIVQQIRRVLTRFSRAGRQREPAGGCSRGARVGRGTAAAREGGRAPHGLRQWLHGAALGGGVWTAGGVGCAARPRPLPRRQPPRQGASNMSATVWMSTFGFLLSIRDTRIRSESPQFQTYQCDVCQRWCWAPRPSVSAAERVRSGGRATGWRFIDMTARITLALTPTRWETRRFWWRYRTCRPRPPWR
jgi:hypothetical protein